MDGKPSISAMASGTDSDVTKLKGTKIFVLVEDALIDVLVVSFHAGSKIFQGVLLDITKKNAPYGIVPPPPPPPPIPTEGESANVEGPEEKTDKLHALKQRHTYYQFPAGSAQLVFTQRQYARNSRDKSVRMRRLRPRKVLCSHCQGIFNDNSDPNQKKTATNRANPNNTNSQCANPINSTSNTGTDTSCDSRLNPRVSTRSCKNDSIERKTDNITGSTDDKDFALIKSDSNCGKDKSSDSACSVVNGESTIHKQNPRTGRMVLRKRKLSEPDIIRTLFPPEKIKRVEDIKTEAVDPAVTNPAVGNNNAAAIKSGLAKTSPVIKISFANPQGKDTVLKIPARVQLTSDTEEDSNWSLQENADFNAKKFASAKAAKKALKKAKKEAQKKATGIVLCQNHENGGTSLGTGPDKDKHHHHKHKVKRKRKRKNGEDGEGDKYNLENTDTRNVFNTTGNEGWCLRTNFPGDLTIVPSELSSKPSNVFEDVKSKCLHQKLSISLKRLNAKAYMRCSPKYSIEEDSIISDISDASGTSVGSGSGSDYGDVPDFPKHTSPFRDMDKVKPLMMRISTHNVKKCMLDIGREMTVGDIVWGKIHGFPWWPGKVLALTVSQRDNGATINQQAHVSWFGSSTSSYMPCNQLTPFLDDFKIRYNRKKRGPYKEAIKQAMHEAQIPPKDIHELSLVAT